MINELIYEYQNTLSDKTLLKVRKELELLSKKIFSSMKIKDNDIKNYLINEVIFKIYKHIHNLDINKNIESYIYTIIKNSYFDYKKNNNPILSLPIEYAINIENTNSDYNYKKEIDVILLQIDIKYKDICNDIIYYSSDITKLMTKYNLTYALFKPTYDICISLIKDIIQNKPKYEVIIYE